MLLIIFGICSLPIFAGNLAHAQVTAAATTEEPVTTAPVSPECASWGVGNQISCQMNKFLIIVLAGIVSLFVQILYFADYLFNIAITKMATLEGFDSLYLKVAPSIAIVWTLFRDLANIVIIGLFVFIAISIILGLKEYGDKKLIARVLIVAILINFSFLFTRIIINLSNAFSSNIYKNLVIPTVGNDGAASTGGASTKLGDTYVKLLNISSLEDTRSTLSKLYGDANGGIGTVFLHTVESVIFTILAIVAFLFAAILLIARFVMLITLLLLSSLAFATYLLPSWAAIGWSVWWNQLLKNAVLAPVMMLFIWVSLTLAQGLQVSNGNLGVLAGNVKDPKGLETAVSYLLIIGLFYLGLFIANNFSNHAALRITTAIPSIGIGAGSLALGLPYAWQAVYRRNKKQKALENELDPIKSAKLQKKISGLDAASKRDWNLMNSSAAKFAAKMPGLKGLAAGQFKTTPYGKALDDKAKAKASAFGPGTLSGAKEKKVRETASTENGSEKIQRQQLEATKKQAQKTEELAKSTERSAKTQHEDSQRAVNAARDGKKALETQHETEIRTSANPEETKRAHEAQMRKADEAIKDATQVSAGHLKVLQEKQAKATAAMQARVEAEHAEVTGNSQIKSSQKLRGEVAVKDFNETLGNYATRFVVDTNKKAAIKKKLGTYRNDHNVSDALGKIKAEMEKGKPVAPAAGRAPAASDVH